MIDVRELKFFDHKKQEKHDQTRRRVLGRWIKAHTAEHHLMSRNCFRYGLSFRFLCWIPRNYSLKVQPSLFTHELLKGFSFQQIGFFICLWFRFIDKEKRKTIKKQSWAVGQLPSHLCHISRKVTRLCPFSLFPEALTHTSGRPITVKLNDFSPLCNIFCKWVGLIRFLGRNGRRASCLVDLSFRDIIVCLQIWLNFDLFKNCSVFSISLC